MKENCPFRGTNSAYLFKVIVKRGSKRIKEELFIQNEDLEDAFCRARNKFGWGNISEVYFYEKVYCDGNCRLC